MNTVLIVWFSLFLFVSLFLTAKFTFKPHKRAPFLKAMPELRAMLATIGEVGGVFGLSIVFVLLGPIILPFFLAEIVLKGCV